MRLQAALPTEQRVGEGKREWVRANESTVLSGRSRVGLGRSQHPGEEIVTERAQCSLCVRQ